MNSSKRFFYNMYYSTCIHCVLKHTGTLCALDFFWMFLLNGTFSKVFSKSQVVGCANN